jgi:hypothetical protein
MDEDRVDKFTVVNCSVVAWGYKNTPGILPVNDPGETKLEKELTSANIREMTYTVLIFKVDSKVS